MTIGKAQELLSYASFLVCFVLGNFENVTSNLNTGHPKQSLVSHVSHHSAALRPEPVLMVAACPFPCRRGTPIRIERLAETIARSGRKVHVVSYHYGEDGPAGPFASDCDAEPGYELHRIPNVPGRWNPAPGPGLGKALMLNPLLLMKVAQVIRQQEIRLLHCHHYEALLIGLTLRKFFPVSVVYDAHTLLGDELAYYVPAAFEAPIAKFGAYLDRTFPKRADHVIPVTEDIYDTLIDHAGEGEKMTIIGNGIEEASIAAFSSKMDPVVRGRVVYAGNLAAYQGIDLLLEAFARVTTKHSDATLEFVSAKPFEAVESMACALGIGDRVSFVDSEGADLPHKLCSADVLVNPRIKCPGYPLKLLNYMAAGRPIVSFKSSGKNLRDGVDASVVPDGDVAAFADAIQNVLSNPQEGDRLGKSARDTAFRHYSWDAIAQRVDDAYEKAMEIRFANVEQMQT